LRFKVLLEIEILHIVLIEVYYVTMAAKLANYVFIVAFTTMLHLIDAFITKLDQRSASLGK